MSKIVFAVASIEVLGVSEIYALYRLLFAIWMTAYPMADHGLWKKIVYEWLSVSTVIGLLFIYIVVWLLRQKIRHG